MGGTKLFDQQKHVLYQTMMVMQLYHNGIHVCYHTAMASSNSPQLYRARTQTGAAAAGCGQAVRDAVPPGRQVRIIGR